MVTRAMALDARIMAFVTMVMVLLHMDQGYCH